MYLIDMIFHSEELLKNTRQITQNDKIAAVAENASSRILYEIQIWNFERNEGNRSVTLMYSVA